MNAETAGTVWRHGGRWESGCCDDVPLVRPSTVGEGELEASIAGIGFGVGNGYVAIVAEHGVGTRGGPQLANGYERVFKVGEHADVVYEDALKLAVPVTREHRHVTYMGGELFDAVEARHFIPARTYVDEVGDVLMDMPRGSAVDY